MEDNEHNLRALQLVVLEIAKEFVHFCDENDLTCFFCGGGCIGAVRHKGFIPWDDDLDFFMPRESYERLFDLWKDTDKLVLARPSEHLINGELCATLQNIKTTFVKPHQVNLNVTHGVGIDIFPLDGCPKSMLKRNAQLCNALLFQLFCSQVVPSKHGKILELLSKTLLAVFSSQGLRYRIWKNAECKMSKHRIQDCEYITELYAGPHYMKNKYPKEAFSKAIYVEFEDTKMPIPVGYDKYLKIAFGDYMKMPPESERTPHHDALQIDLSKPYIP